MYAHYTFEQSKFKRVFVIMNQVSRQKATSKVKKDFYKLMNNSNFGSDCQKNIDNWNFNDDYKDFAQNEIEQGYNNDILSIKEDDPFADAKKYCAGQKRSKKNGHSSINEF